MTKASSFQKIYGKPKAFCIKCRQQFNNEREVDYHHVDQYKKVFAPGGYWKRYGNERMITELRKCVPLCKECHKAFHKAKGYKNTTKEIFLEWFFAK